uniref:Uncharacterized protein n=1 Tax=viral metagenome TaxID=1070528 RepID=A0A6C0H578_9ZZZZ
MDFISNFFNSNVIANYLLNKYIKYTYIKLILNLLTNKFINILFYYIICVGMNMFH